MLTFVHIRFICRYLSVNRSPTLRANLLKRLLFAGCVLALLVSGAAADKEGHRNCLEHCNDRYVRCMRICQYPANKHIECTKILFSCTVNCGKQYLSKH
ncbi:hypothetical protein LSAT2_029965 [Lamellibrachia satsuma]|nr:hypothetical protein LSAT2_029965 [Lamellibrachia satsuma]